MTPIGAKLSRELSIHVTLALGRSCQHRCKRLVVAKNSSGLSAFSGSLRHGALLRALLFADLVASFVRLPGGNLLLHSLYEVSCLNLTAVS